MHGTRQKDLLFAWSYVIVCWTSAKCCKITVKVCPAEYADIFWSHAKACFSGYLSVTHYLSLSQYIYIYIYTSVCVCVFVDFGRRVGCPAPAYPAKPNLGSPVFSPCQRSLSLSLSTYIYIYIYIYLYTHNPCNLYIYMCYLCIIYIYIYRERERYQLYDMILYHTFWHIAAPRPAKHSLGSQVLSPFLRWALSAAALQQIPIRTYVCMYDTYMYNKLCIYIYM